MPPTPRRLLVSIAAIVFTAAACTAASTTDTAAPAGGGATPSAARATPSGPQPAGPTNAPRATPTPAPEDPAPGGDAGLPSGTAATVTVRGETYTFAESDTTRCTVAPTLVSVQATKTEPRLTLLVTWRASGGARHVTFGNPVGRPGVWQAGDSMVGASDVSFAVDGRTAEYVGPMAFVDQTIDEATIRISC